MGRFFKIFDGTALAKRNVVVVTVNYRLGIFGFLAHPALTPSDLATTSDKGYVTNPSAGNYGLLDKVAALTWYNKTSPPLVVIPTTSPYLVSPLGAPASAH